MIDTNVPAAVLTGSSGFPPSSNTSWFDHMKDALNPKLLWQKIKDSKSLLLDIALFFGVGFLIGFFLRKYGQYVAAFIVFCVCLILLSQFNIVQLGINWERVQQVIGFRLPVVPEGGTLVAVYWEWVKINIFPVLSFCVGFLVGLRMS